MYKIYDTAFFVSKGFVYFWALFHSYLHLQPSEHIYWSNLKRRIKLPVNS